MNSKIIDAITSNKTSDILLNENLKASRILCLSVVFFVPCFWLIHHLVNPKVLDYLQPRIGIALLALFIFIFSYINDAFKYKIDYFMLFLYYIITIWIVYLNYSNSFADYYTVLMLATFAIMFLGLKKTTDLKIYATVILCLTILTCYLVKEPQLNRFLVISNFASVTLIS